MNSDSSLPTPRQQQNSADTVTFSKRKKAPTEKKQLSQNPATPTRLSQGLKANSNTTQPVQQAQAEAQKQAILMEAQRTSNLQRFQDFMSRAHTSRRNAGQAQLNIAQLWQVFSQQLAQEWGQQPSPSISGQDSSQANASGNFAMIQTLPQGGRRFAVKSPFQTPSKPLTQQASQSLSTQSPLSNMAIELRAANRMPTLQPYQQSPYSYEQNYMQSPAMSNLSYNPMLTLTAGYNANSPTTSLADVSFGQAKTQELLPRGNDLDLSTGFSVQFQDNDLYPSPPEDLQGTQNAIESSNVMEIPGWASPALGHENEILEGAAETTFGNIDFQMAGNEIADASFSALTNNSTPSFLAHSEAVSQPSYRQKDPNHPKQHGFQQTAVDSAGAAQPTNGSTNLVYHSYALYDARSAPPQRLQSEPASVTTARSSYSSSDTAPARSTVARKRPVAAPTPSTRSPTIAAGAQDFPVCLHCHERWWNETCDNGEPCQNCSSSGTSCERPECHQERGTCTNARCSRVHEGDARFRYVVSRPKPLRRKGKMGDRVDSPVMVMRKRSGEGI